MNRGAPAPDARGALHVVDGPERIYGSMRLEHPVKGQGRKRFWRLELEPHVRMRVKQILPRAEKTMKTIVVQDTPEMAYELGWILSRWPMAIDIADREYLESREALYVEQRDTVTAILNGYRPPDEFRETALPARDYQLEDAALVAAMGRLMIGSDVGLGKTVSALLSLRDPANLPAVFVTMTHLPPQMLAEMNLFLPWLDGYIVKTGWAYDPKTGPTGTRRYKPGEEPRDPDVLFLNYHKLAGWADYLAKTVKTVIFDEIQELRRMTSQKYEAACQVAWSAQTRIGLSVGPDSVIELQGGPFGAGWVGPISTACEVAEREATEVIDVAETTEVHAHKIVRVSDVLGRGWTGEGFGWKPVRSFIKHPCMKPTRELRVGGDTLLLTDDHSVFRVHSEGLEVVRAEDIAVGDLLALDDGARWKQRPEAPLDVVAVAAGRSRAVVQVDLAATSRSALGVKPWEWQNFNRQGKYGSYLPARLYLEHADRLPPPASVYMAVGRRNYRIDPSVTLSSWAYILGFYLGDGWTDRDRVAFAVEDALAPKIEQALRDLPGIELDPKVSQRPGASCEIRCSHPIWADSIRTVTGGAKAKTKYIPGDWIASWPEAARRELLAGLLASDGHVSARAGRRYYSTTSLPLARSLLALLRSLGIAGGMSLKRSAPGGPIDGRVINGGDSYCVHWSAYAEAGIHEGKHGNRRRHHGAGALHEAPVRSVETVYRPPYVYDLEMEGHPSFVANGILVHNSATPVYNYGGEIWAVMNVLAPGELGTWEEFKREWGAGSINAKVKVQDPKALGHHLRETGLMVRRTRTEVGRELAPLTRVPHTIHLEEGALHGLVDDVETIRLAELLASDGGKAKERFKAAGELDWRLRRATGLAKAPYVAAFVDVLLEAEEPVLLFGWHLDCYALWREKLDHHDPVFYTGQESPAAKERSKQAFVNGDTNLMIMSLRSGAGVDGLQHRCRLAVVGELDWSPMVHDQGVGRLWRDGQPDPVTAYFLIADDGADPVMAETLSIKRSQSEPIMDPDVEILAKADPPDDKMRLLARRFLEQRGRR